MTDEQTAEETELVEGAFAALGDTLTTGTLTEAIEHAVAAQKAEPIGDHGLLVRMPGNYRLEQIDARVFEDMPRRIEHRQPLVGCDSLARYVEWHHTSGETRAYLRDVYGRGLEMLTKDTDLCTIVLDDNTAGGEPNKRAHRAVLVLRPTAASRRWGAALSAPLSQERFLSLIVDGIGEIASPDGAVLRQLVSNLHAIRSAEIQSIIRTGGQGEIQLKENVQLSAGAGNRVEFPEEMQIVLQPFAGHPDQVDLPVKITPVVSGNAVHFDLDAPALDDGLARLVGDIAGEIAESTGLTPLWTP